MQRYYLNMAHGGMTPGPYGNWVGYADVTDEIAKLQSKIFDLENDPTLGNGARKRAALWDKLNDYLVNQAGMQHKPGQDAAQTTITFLKTLKLQAQESEEWHSAYLRAHSRLSELESLVDNLVARSETTLATNRNFFLRLRELSEDGLKVIAEASESDRPAKAAPKVSDAVEFTAPKGILWGPNGFSFRFPAERLSKSPGEGSRVAQNQNVVIEVWKRIQDYIEHLDRKYPEQVIENTRLEQILREQVERAVFKDLRSIEFQDDRPYGTFEGSFKWTIIPVAGQPDEPRVQVETDTRVLRNQPTLEDPKPEGLFGSVALS